MRPQTTAPAFSASLFEGSGAPTPQRAHTAVGGITIGLTEERLTAESLLVPPALVFACEADDGAHGMHVCTGAERADWAAALNSELTFTSDAADGDCAEAEEEAAGGCSTEASVEEGGWMPLGSPLGMGPFVEAAAEGATASSSSSLTAVS